MFTKYFNKLNIKMGLYIMLLMTITVTLLGIIYISRYNSIIENRTKSRFMVPSTLISKGEISYTSVSDETIMARLAGIKPLQAFIAGNDGKIYYSLDPSMKNMKLEQFEEYIKYATKLEEYNGPVVDKIKINGKKYYISVSPVYNENNNIVGHLFFKVSAWHDLSLKLQNLAIFLAGAFILLVLSGILLFYMIEKLLIKPMNHIHQIISRLKEGNLNVTVETIENADELGQINNDLKELIDDLNKKAHFAGEIEKGRFDYQYTLDSNEDQLGQALIAMRDSLKHASIEEEKRKAEDAIRNWSTIGLARFGDILRQHFDDINELAFTMIKELVIYLDANQASLFLAVKENDKIEHLELSATYAFDRRKYLNKQILIGEGLIGACAFEKQTIYMTELPENYVLITSGLGEANPTVLLIVPLLREDELLGVIEMASFKKFEKYQIEFVEKICENIASTLYNVSINSKTAILLAQSQENAETMRTQEEEMRQNMEELHSTQEEMGRRQEELMARITELENELEHKQRELDRYKNKNN